jgi:hypothetical protein
MENHCSTSTTRRFVANNLEDRMCDMPVTWAIAKCKKCIGEVRAID